MGDPKFLPLAILSLILILFGCVSKQNKSKQKIKVAEIDTTKFYPVNSMDTLEPIYFATSEFLWRTFVPKSGQAETMQGELIRIVEKLDNEIRGNAKANWDGQFVLLANSLRDSLVESNTFSPDIQNEIRNDINTLTRNDDELYLEDDVYNRLTRRIVEWYWRHKEPIPHVKNINLNR